MYVKSLAHNSIIKYFLSFITFWGISVFLGRSVIEFFLKLCHMHIFQTELDFEAIQCMSMFYSQLPNFFQLNEKSTNSWIAWDIWGE